MERVFAEGTPTEIAMMLGILALAAFCILVPITWITNKIVALREEPLRRAQLTTGIPYGVASLVGIFGADSWLDTLLVPVLLFPGALVIFFWLLADYRRGWIDEDEAIAQGIELENDDWRNGIIIVVVVIVAAAAKVLWRSL